MQNSELKSPDSSEKSLRAGEPLFRFNEASIKEMFDAGIDVNCLFILEVIAKEISLGEMFKEPKVQNWIQTLIRKQLLTKEGKVSTIGTALLQRLTGGKVEKHVPEEDMFEVWWRVYPATGSFEWKGQSFPSTQNKRVKKKECRKVWEEILLEYTPEEVIQGTANHFHLAMDLSVKNRKNEVHFISNSLTYLGNRLFVPYIGERKKGFDRIDTVDI